MRCYEVLWGCYEQPAITAITPVMAAPITLSGDKQCIRLPGPQIARPRPGPGALWSDL